MPKTPLIPLSPTVEAVFSDFLERLKSNSVVEQAVAERLRQVLKEQKFDPESLRGAIFDPVEQSTP